jgi:D-alanine transaminase
MAKISYVDGFYLHHKDSKIHIDDRGYHFGDAVYEVIIFNEGIFFDYNEHIKRLLRSLKSLDIELPISTNSLKIIINNVIKKNRIVFGSVYIQVSRGVAQRNHSYKNLTLKPIIIISTTEKNKDYLNNFVGVSAITLNDNRWARPDIKTTQLLPNILAKTIADKKSAYEAIFIDQYDYITEGSSSNIWIVNYDNQLITRNLDGQILSGITRNSVKKCAMKNNIKVLERKFSKHELLTAKEVFLTSATSFVTPIVKIDNSSINNGLIGELSFSLRELYLKAMKSSN